jgi:hypothetical protein
MKAGDRVEVVLGRHTGRTGYIVVLEHADLKRLRKPRRGRFVQESEEL